MAINQTADIDPATGRDATTNEPYSDVDAQQAGSKVPDVVQGETDEDILVEARDRYRMCEDAEGDNYRMARDDLLFLTGGLNQWEPESAQIRTHERRPCLTVNNLPTFLHQVTNEQRMNTPSIKVHPVDDNADVETAAVLQGLIRHIEYDSNADVAFDRAVNSAAAIGQGYFRLVTEFEDENSFDQKIMFKSIRNSLSVKIDPLSTEPDTSDKKFCFIESLEPRKEFERQYPTAAANNQNLIGNELYQGWFDKDTVVVCEYYRIKEYPATLVMLSNGQAVFEDELAGITLPPGLYVTDKKRQSYRCKVEWFKITGADVLERTEIKCKWIPVFTVYGDEIDIDGRVVRSGVIRNAKDPFRMYNYWITLATEEVALRPKSPFIAAFGQTEEHSEWLTANTRSWSVLTYDPKTVDGLLVPAPQRQAPADIPNGSLAMMMHAADNKKATTGLFDSSLGARGSATSGIQEREQQQQGDMANFHYTDNLNRTVRHVGRCIVSMIPHYYDGARSVRMLGDDDVAEQVKINATYQRKNKAGDIETVIHDLTAGKYDVTVSAGPSYSTKRQEAAEFLTEAMRAAKDPAASAVITYLAFKNQDMAGADDATRMLKKLLPPNVAEQEEGEAVVMTAKGPLPVSQVPQVLEQMEQALQGASEQLEQAELLKEQNRQAELALKSREVDIKAYSAETDRLKVSIEVTKAETEKKEADEALAGAATGAVNELLDIELNEEALQILASAAQPQGGMPV